ncbi:hypothetical protein S40293_00900 [Stachybotrys chartarum IBT 40293]|nr:hypothetical protein S40293_00900 [Stachybotrys chartarum IBT 40293]
MPLQNYGVWKATPIAFTAQRRDQDPHSPHGSLKFEDGVSSKKLSSAINVKSLSPDSRLVYWLIQDFKHPLLERLAQLPRGWHDIAQSDTNPSDGIALDLLRQGVVDIAKGKIVPHDVDGENNDVVDFLIPFFDNAIKRKATVYIYGEKYDGDDGVHDVHMNQGSQGRFKSSNGTYQDGGAILEFEDGHWETFFIAFASQATVTDDNGHGTGPSFAEFLASTPSEENDGGTGEGGDGTEHEELHGLYIEAALINPEGPDNQGNPELVYIRNGSSRAVSLNGIVIANQGGMSYTVLRRSEDHLQANKTQGLEVPGVPLSNRGGSIVLKGRRGKVLDQVSYTKEQASRSGGLVYFDRNN